MKRCAAIMKHSIRQGDVLARIGGDEFVILMPNTSIKAGEKVFFRIDSKLKKYKKSHPHLPVGISLGLSFTEGPVKTLEETYAEADHRMYRMKKMRN